MKEGLLADQAEFASKPLRDHLKRDSTLTAPHSDTNIGAPGSAQKADQVFLPVLENSLKAQKLRTTLSVFERSRFFFNLPRSLIDSIEAVSDFSMHVSLGYKAEEITGSIRCGNARLQERQVPDGVATRPIAPNRIGQGRPGIGGRSATTDIG